MTAARYDLVLSPDGCAVPPQFGIGYGQRGFWGNQHFATYEEAEAAFTDYLTNLRQVFGRYIEVERPMPAGSNVLRATTLKSVLKSGKPGSICHSVHLYRIDA